jgi:CRP-like cAMP-binding protein
VITEMPLHSMRDRILLLRSLHSFAGLDDEGLRLVAEHAKSRLFRAGETLLTEGRIPEHVYVVLSGQLRSTRLGKLLAVVTRPRGAGFLSMNARDENGVHVVADEDTQTLEIPVHALQSALEENFSLVRNTLRNSAGALVRKRGHLPASPNNPPALSLGEYRDEPRTMVELLIELGEGGIFATANIDALIAVARTTVEVRAEAGEMFWAIGEPSTSWLRIAHGRVRCTSADGKVVDVGSRFILGNLDALAGDPRSYSARAETRIVAFRTELEPFLAVLESHFELARSLIALLSKALLATPDPESKT